MRRKNLAPSEEHLEGFLWRHPEVLASLIPGWVPVARQLDMPSGRADLLGTGRTLTGKRLYVVELKRGRITSSALTQVLRYMRSCYGAMARIMDLYREQDPDDMAVVRWRSAGGVYYLQDLIGGYLIGSELPDEDLYDSCSATGVGISTYSYDGEYHFGWHEVGDFQEEREAGDLGSLVFGEIGGALLHVLLSGTGFEPSFNAVEAARHHIEQYEKNGGEQ